MVQVGQVWVWALRWQEWRQGVVLVVLVWVLLRRLWVVLLVRVVGRRQWVQAQFVEAVATRVLQHVLEVAAHLSLLLLLLLLRMCLFLVWRV